MIQESNEDMCGMGISKQSESAKNDRYVSAGAKPEKNACKAEAQCICVSREPGMYCRVCFLFFAMCCRCYRFCLYMFVQVNMKKTDPLLLELLSRPHPTAMD